jgi:hypothetical protein
MAFWALAENGNGRSMAILAIHRAEPRWPADPARPIYKHGVYWVETNGPVPTSEEVTRVLSPPLVVKTPDEKIDTFLASLGVTAQELKDRLAKLPASSTK